MLCPKDYITFLLIRGEPSFFQLIMFGDRNILLEGFLVVVGLFTIWAHNTLHIGSTNLVVGDHVLRSFESLSGEEQVHRRAHIPIAVELKQRAEPFGGI